MTRRFRRQAGLGLVEVMVAALVLSVGLIALAKLQVDLVRGSSDARARTVALSLAEEKLEDLRGFGTVDSVTPWTPGVGTLAWSHIAGNAGGRLASVGTYGSALEVSGTQFTRTWAASAPLLLPGTTEGRYKEVTVAVAWRDATGIEQTVRLASSIAAANPADIVLPAADPTSQPGPRVNYTPGLAPTIIAIPIDLGGGRKRETTKPLPDVSVGGGLYHQVTFDVVNFTVGSPTTADKREEFATVNCRCELAGAAMGRTPARVKFEDGQLADEAGKIVSKPQTGTVPPGAPEGLCTVCCRDHHDGPEIAGNPNRYKPTDSTDHLHYRVSGGTYVAATSTGDEYDEACRLKRIGGVFQVFEDWNLKDVTVVPFDYLDDGTTSQTRYTNYVRDFVQAAVADDSSPDKSTAARMPHIMHMSDVNGRDLLMQPGMATPAMSRGLFIDRMPAALESFVRRRISAGEPFLEFVPFYEVNMTKLADWELNRTTVDGSLGTTPVSNATPCPPGRPGSPVVNAMVLCVTSEAIVDEGLVENRYSRGEVQAGGTGGVAQVESKAKTANSGIAGSAAISAIDETTASDYVNAQNSAATGYGSVSGSISFCSAMTDIAARKALWRRLSVEYSGGLSGSCTLIPRTPPSRGTFTSGSYSCNTISEGASIRVAPEGVADSAPDYYDFTITAGVSLLGSNFTICDS